MDESTILFPSNEIYSKTIGAYLTSCAAKKPINEKKAFRYRDPKTGKSYNTTDEFYKFRTVLYKSE